MGEIAKAAGERAVSLLRDWRAVLEAETPPGDAGWFADLPIERVVSQRIWKMYRRVLKAGRTAIVHGEAEAMHELRKDCKKLRYLIEFFRGLYPPRDVKELIRALKELLDNLGQFQDLEVQADKLRAFARDFDPQEPSTLPTVMAIGALVADLLRRTFEFLGFRVTQIMNITDVTPIPHNGCRPPKRRRV